MGWLAASGVQQLLEVPSTSLRSLGHSVLGWAAPAADFCANATYEHRLDNPDEYNYCRRACLAALVASMLRKMRRHSLPPASYLVKQAKTALARATAVRLYSS